jgi:hypothetical protein
VVRHRHLVPRTRQSVRQFDRSVVRSFQNRRTLGTHGTAVDTHRRGVGAPNSRTFLANYLPNLSFQAFMMRSWFAPAQSKS